MTLQALHFSKITKFKSYKYSLNHQGKWFTIFIIYCIHIFLIISLHNLIVKLFFFLLEQEWYSKLIMICFLKAGHVINAFNMKEIKNAPSFKFYH